MACRQHVNILGGNKLCGIDFVVATKCYGAAAVRWCSATEFVRYATVHTDSATGQCLSGQKVKKEPKTAVPVVGVDSIAFVEQRQGQEYNNLLAGSEVFCVIWYNGSDVCCWVIFASIDPEAIAVAAGSLGDSVRLTAKKQLYAISCPLQWQVLSEDQAAFPQEKAFVDTDVLAWGVYLLKLFVQVVDHRPDLEESIIIGLSLPRHHAIVIEMEKPQNQLKPVSCHDGSKDRVSVKDFS